MAKLEIEDNRNLKFGTGREEIKAKAYIYCFL